MSDSYVCKKTTCEGYGFSEDEIKLICEAHETIDNMSGFSYSDNIIRRRKKDKRKKKAANIISAIVGIIIIGGIMLYAAYWVTDGFDHLVTLGSFIIALGVIIYCVACIFWVFITNTTSSLLHIFLRMDNNLEEDEKKREKLMLLPFPSIILD